MREGAHQLASLFLDPAQGRGEYVAYPNARAPRWVLPRAGEAKRRGFAICTPHSAKGRVVKKLWQYGVLPGAPLSLHPEYLRLLQERLAAAAGGAVDLCFYVGTPGTFQKITALSFASNGDASHCAKIAFHALAQGSLHRERENLARLEGIPAVKGQVPTVVDHFSLLDAEVLVTSVGPGDASASTFSRGHLAFLQALAASGSESRLGDSEFWALQHAVYRQCLPFLSHDWQRRYQAVFPMVEKELGAAALPFSVAHRDFVPWNIRRCAGDAIYVFDWEFAREGYPASHDFFHFHFMVQLMLKGGVRYADVRTWIAALPYRHGGALFLAFLLDLALFYHKSAFDRGEYRDDRVLQAAASLIDRRDQWL